MKPTEIYQLTPIETSYRFSQVQSAIKSLFTNDGKELPINSIWDDLEYETEQLIEQEKRFEIRTYMSEGDDKWGANLYSVYFDNKPLMIVKNDGRYFEDYDTYLTDIELFNSVEEYIRSHMKNKRDLSPCCYNPESDIEGLEEVNHHNLHDYYMSNPVPQYEVGEVVWAWVAEDHLKQSYNDGFKGYVLTKVEIKEIKPNHRLETYWGVQLERGFKEVGTCETCFSHNLTYKMPASFADADIVGRVDEIAMPEWAVNNLVDADGRLPEDYKMLEIPTQQKLKIKM